jgi:hypothetical protein
LTFLDTDFWRIIDASREAANDDSQRQIDALARILRGLSDADFERFTHWFDTFFARAYRWDLWEAGQIVNGGMGEDSFADFRDWLISGGRDRFERVLEHPDNLLDVPAARLGRMTCGAVRDAIYEAYDGADRDDLLATGPAQPADPEGAYPVDVRRTLPRIFERFRGKYDWGSETSAPDDADPEERAPA